MVELLTLCSRSTNEMEGRVDDLPEQHKADVLKVGVGMLSAAGEVIGEMMGIPHDAFLRTMALNIAKHEPDYGGES